MPPDNFQVGLERRGRVSWRPFPCPSCGEGRSPGDFLRASFVASEAHFGSKLDQQIKVETRLLGEWVGSCPHTEIQHLDPPLLAEGSEHSVYLRAEIGQVYKVTLPGIFGDWYYLKNGVIHQGTSTPFEYLVRLEIWEHLFGREGAAPVPIGLTSIGQIVTRQKFIESAPASQIQVEDGLEDDGWVAVKKSAYVWKKAVTKELEIWLGDARDENFALRDGRLIPIDIRLWFVIVI